MCKSKEKTYAKQHASKTSQFSSNYDSEEENVSIKGLEGFLRNLSMARDAYPYDL